MASMLSAPLFWRALFAFLVLPGIVAFYVPLMMLRGTATFGPAAVPVIAVGIVLLGWCIRDFYVAGQGTLAPWSPPKHLVTVGLYRVSRNPMYLAVLLILIGWAIGFHARALWVYAGCVAIGFHLRVVLFEEPWLARTHGRAWNDYRGEVRRWFGRRSPR